MDNADFKTDTLTGASETNHRTNVMFVQNKNLVKNNISKTKIPTLINPKDLRKLVEELNKVHQYKTTNDDDPSIRYHSRSILQVLMICVVSNFFIL